MRSAPDLSANEAGVAGAESAAVGEAARVAVRHATRNGDEIRGRWWGIGAYCRVGEGY